MINEVRKVLVRDLMSLHAALHAYPNEASIWALPKGISNSAGTLALHLAGNLQHYIGAQLGGSGYVRDRTAEFSDRDVPLAVIDHRIETTIRVITETFNRLDVRTLDESYPLEIGGHTLSTRLFLTHLISHAGYHLGQIDYHRRLVTGVNKTAGPSIGALAEAS